VSAWLARYVWADFIIPVWPNVAATPFVAAVSATWTAWRVRVHLAAHHDRIAALLAAHRAAQDANRAAPPAR